MACDLKLEALGSSRDDDLALGRDRGADGQAQNVALRSPNAPLLSGLAGIDLRGSPLHPAFGGLDDRLGEDGSGSQSGEAKGSPHDLHRGIEVLQGAFPHLPKPFGDYLGRSSRSNYPAPKCEGGAGDGNLPELRWSVGDHGVLSFGDGGAACAWSMRFSEVENSRTLIMALISTGGSGTPQRTEFSRMLSSSLAT
jgi:hypothetical protein